MMGPTLILLKDVVVRASDGDVVGPLNEIGVDPYRVVAANVRRSEGLVEITLNDGCVLRTPDSYWNVRAASSLKRFVEDTRE